MSSTIMTQGEIIKKARNKKKLSGHDLNKLTGISQTMISMIENGQRNLTPETINKLSKTLDIEAEALVNAPPSENRKNNNRKKNTYNGYPPVIDKEIEWYYYEENLYEIGRLVGAILESQIKSLSPQKTNLICHLLKSEIKEHFPKLIDNAMIKLEKCRY
jgi:transcriptional regulator with XRE-family HTH domain